MRRAIIDAHHHVWDLSRNIYPWLQDEPMIPFRYGDYSAIRRDYLPADFRRDAARYDLKASVYVEAEWDHADPLGETAYIHALADAEGLPTVMVAQAWLDRADAAEVLTAQAAWPRVRSVRHKPKAARLPTDARRGEAGSMDDEAWRRGFAMLAPLGLRFDLQVHWWHMDQAHDLAADFPGTTIIINHTGLPADRSAEGLAGWRRMMGHVARQANVMLKISGLGVPGQAWTPQANGPIIRDALAMFGTRRCMFASNFPVDSLCGTFDAIFGGFETIVAALPETEQAALFHDNASRIYAIT
jgi:predicted TIM-barrel fold metal-dependent hydrolase